jgi:hypothetical protein
MVNGSTATDDIEKSVEASLEEFVNQANAAFAEDFDGWDIAQTTAEVRFFMEGKKQQDEAAHQAQEAIKLQQVKPPAPVAPITAAPLPAESTAIVKPLPSPAGGGTATRQRQAVEARQIRHEDQTVPTAKLPVEEVADKTVPQPKVASQGMSRGFLFATMLGAFLVGAIVVLLVVKFFFVQPPPPVVLQPTPPTPPPAEPAAAPAVAPAPAVAAPAAPTPAPAAAVAKEPEPEPKAAPEPKVEPEPKAAAAPKAAKAPVAARPAAPRAPKPAVAKPAAPKPAAPAKPKKKTKGAGELIDVF